MRHRDGLDGCGKSRPLWDSIPGPSHSNVAYISFVLTRSRNNRPTATYKYVKNYIILNVFLYQFLILSLAEENKTASRWHHYVQRRKFSVTFYEKR